MTILAGVLALTPVLCWELADATGPAASDVSGNGNAGVYAGVAFALDQPGPEVGTKSTLFTGTGGVQTVAAVTPVPSPPWSFHAWIAARTLTSTFPHLFAQQAGGNGEAIYFGANDIQAIQQGIRQYSLAVPVSDGGWHQYIWTRDGANNVALYVDGLQRYTQAGITVGSPTTGKFDSGLNTGVDAAFYYGVALWNLALSPAQVSTLFGSVSAPLQQPANLNTVSGYDLTAISANLNALPAVLQQLVKSTTSPAALSNPYSGSGSLSANAGGVFALGLHWSVNTAPSEAGQTPRSILIYSQAFLAFSVSYTLHDASTVVGETVLSGEAEGLYIFDGPQPASIAYNILPGWTVHLDWLVKP